MTAAKRAARSLVPARHVLRALVLACASVLCIGGCRSGIVTLKGKDFTLNLPDAWTATPIPSPFFAADAAFGITWPDWKKVVDYQGSDYEISEYPVYLCVYPGSLASSSGHYGWITDGSSWWLEGRDRSDAAFSSGTAFDSLTGEVIVGDRAKEGSDALSSVAATAFMTVLDDRRGHLFVFTADTFFEDRGTFDGIVAGLRAGN